MMIASDEVTPDAIFEAVRNILGELELGASEDASLPGFAISFDVDSKPICLYLRVLGTDGIRVSARLPVNFANEEKAMACLLLANEITRSIHFGAVYFQPEEQQMEVRIATILTGLPNKRLVGNLLHRIIDMILMVSKTLDCLCEEKNGFQEALACWEEALEQLKADRQREKQGNSTDAVTIQTLPVLRN